MAWPVRMYAAYQMLDHGRTQFTVKPQDLARVIYGNPRNRKLDQAQAQSAAAMLRRAYKVQKEGKVLTVAGHVLEMEPLGTKVVSAYHVRCVPLEPSPSSSSSSS